MKGKIKRCLLAGYDIDLINKKELEDYWKYIDSIEDTPKEDKKIEHIETNYDFVFDEQVQQDSLRVIASKINEIIDKVNGE